MADVASAEAVSICASAEATLKESTSQYHRSQELYTTKVLSDAQIEQIEATFRSSDVMNDALISGSVDFVCLGIPGIITIWSKTKGTPIEVKAATGFNVSPLMLMVRDPVTGAQTLATGLAGSFATGQGSFWNAARNAS